MRKPARIVIVGYPNVGKSTLFNRLLGKKRALVHSEPGMTRDCVAAPCVVQEKGVLLVDTGGFFDSQEGALSQKIRDKAWEAARGADLVLFVLDGKRDPLPGEGELLISLKKLNKPVLLVVNKVDSEMQEENLSEFYRLEGENIFPISAEHKRNLEQLERGLGEALPEAQAVRDEVEPLRVALIGRINVGKSSLVNRLLNEERLIVSEMPGTTRDTTDTLIWRNKKAYCLLDTAGIRKLSRTRDLREKAGIIKAKANISRADVICLVMDAQEFPTRQDTAVAHLAQDSGKPLVIALNKWDLVQGKEQRSTDFVQRLFRRLEFISYAPVLLVSALTGKGVVKILDSARDVYANSLKKVGTSRLNEFLAWVNQAHPPVSRSGKKIKVKYMVQKGVHPPSFILFLPSKVSLSPSYQKFFARLLRQEFGFSGNPVRILQRTDRVRTIASGKSLRGRKRA